MAWFAPLLLVVVAFGGMAVAFGRSERAEERRILARAEAVLARDGIAFVVPEDGEAAGTVVFGPGPGVAPALCGRPHAPAAPAAPAAPGAPAAPAAPGAPDTDRPARPVRSAA